MISVTILTKNSSKYIKKVLSQCLKFDEVIVLDSGSTDDTLNIVYSFSNVKIYNCEFEGFGKMHVKAENYAKNDWILSIDSDEIITDELVDSILCLNLNEKEVYSFDFDNYFNGKLIKCCGWYPDNHIRLYNKKTSGFTDDKVHESIKTEGLRVVKLKHKVIHYSYDNIEDFLRKLQFYSTLFAEQYVGEKKTSVYKAFSHGLFAFIKSYFIKKGFTQGYEGFVISSYNASVALYKYLKLYEYNKRQKNAPSFDVSPC